VKTLITILMLLITLTLTACSERIVEVPKPYAVPVACKTPDVECGVLQGTPIEKTNTSLECISKLKKSNEVCK
jgi:hypothetical protein